MRWFKISKNPLISRSTRYIPSPNPKVAPITIFVHKTRSCLVVQETFFNSSLISKKKFHFFVFLPVSVTKLTTLFATMNLFVLTGECGGTRTPDRRLWRPLLYQLSYTPIKKQRKPSAYRYIVVIE